MSAISVSITPDNASSELFSKANARKLGGLNYAGELSASEAYELLQNVGGLLVDVRSVPEWQFVGTPDVSATQGQFATISWKTYPQMTVNPEFSAQLANSGVSKDIPIYFICKTGGRSLDASVAMTEAGHAYCFNITNGFEGDVNDAGHRGAVNGWKAANLPWKQG